MTAVNLLPRDVGGRCAPVLEREAPVACSKVWGAC